MNEQEQQIRIAIVDDHEMFRAGVIATLQPHFDIVGQAADVEGSVAMIAQTKPDVVLLDVHVPGGEGGGGAEILVKSRAYSPNTVFLAHVGGCHRLKELLPLVHLYYYHVYAVDNIAQKKSKHHVKP